MAMFWIQFALVLGAVLIGIRRGGVALGMIGGLGVSVLVLGFHTPPSEPPVAVMLIILAVVTASATLQMAGGLDYLVQLTEKLLRAHPKYVTILAPLSTFLLTVCCGTGHAVYALLPVISDVALKTNIRPERPMAVSSVASQMAITASPVAAAVTFFLGFASKAGHPVRLTDILMVTLPAGVIGVLAAAVWSFSRGKELDQDPDYLARLEDPDFQRGLAADVTTLDKEISGAAKISVALFFAAVGSIILLASYPHLLPIGPDKKPLAMTTVVQFVMLGYGAFIMFWAKVNAKEIANSSVFIAGMIAVVYIFGIAWMSDTFISANKKFLVDHIGTMVRAAPWTFAIATFCISAFVKSQAATLAITLPLGLALGLPVPLLLGLMPASYAYFFFAFYPSDLAAMNMDRTGTTRIGKYLLNHSFMIPGLIGVGISTSVAYGISRVML